MNIIFSQFFHAIDILADNHCNISIVRQSIYIKHFKTVKRFHISKDVICCYKYLVDKFKFELINFCLGVFFDQYGNFVM